jgi:thioredoxin reductase (NADPH)
MADAVAFPVLSAAELAECTEFGTRCSFAPGEEIFRAGSQSFDCFVIVSGDVCIMDVSTDEPTCIVRFGAGQFTGDIDFVHWPPRGRFLSSCHRGGSYPHRA